MFQFFSDQYETHGLIYRLNYANDVSYGVLLEIAQAVFQQRPIDVTMGYVNVIWQGDANEYAVRCLLHGQSPMQVLNITGPETLSVRELALKFGRIFGLTPILVGEEADTALLSNASKAMELLGPPLVSLDAMVTLIAEWVKAGGKTRNKPTHFQERHGDEFIRFSGVVNPLYINNNTVSSTQVADARIEFKQNGFIDSAQVMGWLGRFFLTFMPF